MVFTLKGGAKLTWQVPDADKFNFPLCIKMMRADGHFIADQLYILASEVVAARLEPSRQ